MTGERPDNSIAHGIAAGLATGLILALADAALASRFGIQGLQVSWAARLTSLALLPAIGGALGALTAFSGARRYLLVAASALVVFGLARSAAAGAKAATMPLAAAWPWIGGGAAILVAFGLSKKPRGRGFAVLAFGSGALIYFIAATNYRGLYVDLRAWAMALAALAIFVGCFLGLPRLRSTPVFLAWLAAVVAAGFGFAQLKNQDMRDWAERSTSALAPIAGAFDSASLPEPPPVIEEGGDELAFFGTSLDSKSRERLLGEDGEIHRVLFLVIDALRADMVGRQVDGRSLTPTLDALAKESVVFKNAYTPAPFSQLALISIFSGYYPGLAVQALERKDEGLFVAERLKRRGINTYSATSRLALDGPVKALTDQSLGFEHLAHAAGLDLPIEPIYEWMQRHSGGKRWFGYLHHFGPHAPYEPSPEYRMGDTDLELYMAEVREADAHLGRFIERLKREKVWDDMLLVISADHGEEFMEHGRTHHGHNLYRESTHVPLYITGGRVEPAVVEDLVSLIDLAPTIDQVFALPPEGRPRYQGRSLLPLCFGMEDAGRQPDIVVEVPHFNISRTLPARTALFTQTHSFTVDERRGRLYLYDLRVDPGEKKNLATRQPELARELWARALYLRGRQQKPVEEIDLFGASTEMMMDFQGQWTLAKSAGGARDALEHPAVARLFAGFVLSKRYLELKPLKDLFDDYPDDEVQAVLAALRVLDGEERSGDRERVLEAWKNADDAIVLSAFLEAFRKVKDRRLLDLAVADVRNFQVILDLTTMAYRGQFDVPADPGVLRRGLDHELKWVRLLAARMAGASGRPELHALLSERRLVEEDPKLKHEIEKARMMTHPKKP